MNDLTRRGFLGRLSAAVTALALPIGGNRPRDLPEAEPPVAVNASAPSHLASSLDEIRDSVLAVRPEYSPTFVGFLAAGRIRAGRHVAINRLGYAHEANPARARNLVGVACGDDYRDELRQRAVVVRWAA